MTNEQIENFKQEYKNFCLTNRVRYSLDGCGDPISKTRSRKHKNDHLFCIYKHGMIGVHISRETPWKFRNAVAKIIGLEANTDKNDQFEGNFQLSFEKGIQASLVLKTSKTNANSSVLSDRMKNLKLNSLKRET